LEIAKAAGVSRTTVSFVLNNARGKNIGEETRQKVIATAQALGYSPDAAAVSTATSRDGAVGLFVCHSESVFSDAYIMRLLEGMGPVFNKGRLDLRVRQFSMARSDYAEIAAKDGYLGVILINLHEDDPGISRLASSGLPFVVVGSLPDREVTQVDIDNVEAARKAAEHLLSLGHRDVAVVAHADPAFIAVHDRLAGFLGAFEAAGAALPSERLKFAGFTVASGHAAALSLLSYGTPPTAIFATNDMVAYGVLEALEEVGLHVPRDVSVVGFDDDYFSRYTNPPLTTVTLPAEGIGRIAAEVLLRVVAGGGTERVRLPVSLTIRRSSAQVGS